MTTATISPGQIRRGSRPPDGEGSVQVSMETGTKIGNAYLKWAFSEAAVLFLRDNPAGQKYLARMEKQHGKGKAPESDVVETIEMIEYTVDRFQHWKSAISPQ